MTGLDQLVGLPGAWSRKILMLSLNSGKHAVTDWLVIPAWVQDWGACGYPLFLTAAAKLLQLCPTLCDSMDGSPPDSPVPGILQARTLEWVAVSFSSAWKWEVKVKSFSHVWLFETLWTSAHQAPPSMGFSRQEYWSGLPLPSPVPYWLMHKNALNTGKSLDI